MLRPDFVIRVSEIKNDKPKLLELLNELEAEKRDIKKKLQKFSNSPKSETGLDTKMRERLIRSLLAKRTYLQNEALHVRNAIHEHKRLKSHVNKVLNNKKPGLGDAFMAAAEKLLSEEQFVEIELRALELLDQNTNN